MGRTDAGTSFDLRMGSFPMIARNVRWRDNGIGTTGPVPVFINAATCCDDKVFVRCFSGQSILSVEFLSLSSGKV